MGNLVLADALRLRPHLLTPSAGLARDDHQAPSACRPARRTRRLLEHRIIQHQGGLLRAHEKREPRTRVSAANLRGHAAPRKRRIWPLSAPGYRVQCSAGLPPLNRRAHRCLVKPPSAPVGPVRAPRRYSSGIRRLRLCPNLPKFSSRGSAKIRSPGIEWRSMYVLCNGTISTKRCLSCGSAERPNMPGGLTQYSPR